MENMKEKLSVTEENMRQPRMIITQRQNRKDVRQYLKSNGRELLRIEQNSISLDIKVA